MTDVAEFTGFSRLPVPAEKIIATALECGMTEVVIVGVAADGSFYFASSMPDAADAMYWLQRGIWALNKTADQIEEEGLPE